MCMRMVTAAEQACCSMMSKLPVATAVAMVFYGTVKVTDYEKIIS